MSFDLTQGYLQLAMEEGDIQETAFRASSSGLYEFTCMTFGLSNGSSSICHLTEQCLGDQQFVTVLMYLDDICIFVVVYFLWNRTIDSFEDKLSSTTVDFIRSEG